MMTLTAVAPQMVMADEIEKPYLSLGADLKSDEKATVFKLLGVDAANLDAYEIVTITNADEHDYLDDYLASSIIGSRALSSVLIEKKGEGNGIHVTTKNITYCTEGMYQNALTTAGVTDADVVVAGPFNITGTAALVGAMKGYEDMTGEVIEESTKDTATEELVLTGNLAEELGDSDKAEQLIAMLKEYVSKQDFTEEGIRRAIEKGEEELDIKLTDDQKEEITKLMKRIDDLDLDVDQLKKQAKQIYDKLSSIQINNKNFFDAVIDFFNRLLDMF